MNRGADVEQLEREAVEDDEYWRTVYGSTQDIQRTDAERLRDYRRQNQAEKPFVPKPSSNPQLTKRTSLMTLKELEQSQAEGRARAAAERQREEERTRQREAEAARQAEALARLSIKRPPVLRRSSDTDDDDDE